MMASAWYASPREMQRVPLATPGAFTNLMSIQRMPAGLPLQQGHSQLDRKKTKINFVNIRDKSYNPSQHGGVLYEDAMRHLHVVDGTQVSLSRLCLCARFTGRHPVVEPAPPPMLQVTTGSEAVLIA